MVIILVCVALLTLPWPLWAADVVCGTSAQLCRYLPSTSLGKVTQGTCVELPAADPPVTVNEICSAITSAATIDQQRSFLQANPDIRKLKVVNGLVELKDQSIRDAIDAADAAAAADLAAAQAELAGAGCASDSLADAEQKIHNQMDIARADANAITNVTTAKAAALTIIDKTELILVNVARCFYGLLRTR